MNQKCVYILPAVLFPFVGGIYDYFVTINTQMQVIFFLFLKRMVKDCHSLCHIKLKQLQPLPLYFCDNWLHDLQTNHTRVEQDEAIWAWAKCAFLDKGRNRTAWGLLALT